MVFVMVFKNILIQIKQRIIEFCNFVFGYVVAKGRQKQIASFF